MSFGTEGSSSGRVDMKRSPNDRSQEVGNCEPFQSAHSSGIVAKELLLKQIRFR
ncbi:hypothetical protein [Burkholderia multivorans]|uniref:hypothetical protein n=1 Tax=Burkholderia multivorans TaxID=87883 RepID=UPI001CC2E3ED|nr:hypothetical protein [Burkholderia multivorans]MCO7347610.1 hypothetical protein [Burkholderia multivorans]MDN7942338.1 hypothetical protein [Burkholderia multivorans]